MSGPARQRLAALRDELQRQGLDGFIVPRADEHLGEYVPASAERLAWLTGFTGSAGLAVVLADKAAVFTDGRYVLQLAAQTDPDAVGAPAHHRGPAARLAGRQRTARGEDRLRPAADQRGGAGRYTEAGLDHAAGDAQPGRRGVDRPAAAAACARGAASAGVCRAKPPRKSASRSPALLREAKQDAAVISDPASIAWLLNIRGGDVPFTPFALGFALAHADGGTELFMDPAKLPDATRAVARQHGVRGRARGVGTGAGAAGAASGCGSIPPARRSGSPRRCARRARRWWPGPDPCLLPKACKNDVGAAGRPQRPCARRGGGVPVPALSGGGWPDGAARPKCRRRRSCWRLRQEVEGFRGESFPAISGAGEHGAIIHYRVTEETNRPIRPNEVYLIDSGAQFPDGTTDITRTVWTGPGEPPAELRERVTRVLKGHIAIATAGVPARRRRRASGRLRPARAVAGRAGLRPRHRPRRRQLSVGP